MTRGRRPSYWSMSKRNFRGAVIHLAIHSPTGKPVELCPSGCLERPHQGLGNLTPYEKLKSLGYPTGEEICLFPTLILNSVCCLDPFKIKTKSVQYHLDHDQGGKIEKEQRESYHLGKLVPTFSELSVKSLDTGKQQFYF